RLVTFDGSGGNQDRALAAAAVVSPPFCGIVGSVPTCPSSTNIFSAITDTTNAVTYLWSLTNFTGSAAILGSLTNSFIQVSNSSSGSFQLGLLVTSDGMVSTPCSQFVFVATNLTSTALTNLIACPGTTAIFTTVASGTAPFSYVWRKNGAAITNATA